MSAKAIQNISVIGAGAWGTALAQIFAANGRNVTLYARNTMLAANMGMTGENAAYLKGVKLDPRMMITNEPVSACQGADLVFMVVPAQHLRASLVQFKNYLPSGVPIINGAKGIEVGTGLLLSEVAKQVLPDHPYAILSGPSFAHEVAKGLPCALTLATETDASVAKNWAAAIQCPAFRPYLSADPAGVECAGALKNVIAIACGIVEGKALGQNARAAVMTRGMAEIKRFGLSRGAKAETFLGLAGIGDLTLTCNSMASRNFSLGFEIGQGKALADIMASRHTVAEGAPTAAAVAEISRKSSIDMPITKAVDAILHHGLSVDAAMKELLTRALRQEEE